MAIPTRIVLIDEGGGELFSGFSMLAPSAGAPSSPSEARSRYVSESGIYIRGETKELADDGGEEKSPGALAGG